MAPPSRRYGYCSIPSTLSERAVGLSSYHGGSFTRACAIRVCLWGVTTNKHLVLRVCDTRDVIAVFCNDDTWYCWFVCVYDMYTSFLQILQIPQMRPHAHTRT